MLAQQDGLSLIAEIAAGFAGFAGFAVNAFFLYQGLTRSLAVDLPLKDWSAYAIFWPTEAVCQLTLLANVFGLVPSMDASLYLAFLYSALVQMAWIFLELLDSAFHPTD